MELEQQKDISSYESGAEFWQHPEKYIPIDDVGHDRLLNFYGRFAVLLLQKNMPIFERAYEVLTERGNYSRDNAFGEMKGDRYLWVEKHPSIKVLVLEAQSYSFIYIKDGFSFYIRAIANKLDYPEYRKVQYKNSTIEKFRKCGFKISKSFSAFAYGDGRDDCHIMSCEGMYGLKDVPEEKQSNDLVKAIMAVNCMRTTDNPDYRTIRAIEDIAQWEYYLDDPDDLT